MSYGRCAATSELNITSASPTCHVDCVPLVISMALKELVLSASNSDARSTCRLNVGLLIGFSRDPIGFESARNLPEVSEDPGLLWMIAATRSNIFPKALGGQSWIFIVTSLKDMTRK